MTKLKPTKPGRHPIQPVYVDDKGARRFKENAIVRRLLDEGGIDLNKIAAWDVSQEDRAQFAQLIGYSLSGYSELSYVTDADYEAAQLLGAAGPAAARADRAEGLLEELRTALRSPISRLYGVHPDDLPTREGG